MVDERVREFRKRMKILTELEKILGTERKGIVKKLKMIKNQIEALKKSTEA